MNYPYVSAQMIYQSSFPTSTLHKYMYSSNDFIILFKVIKMIFRNNKKYLRKGKKAHDLCKKIKSSKRQILLAECNLFQSMFCSKWDSQGVLLVHYSWQSGSFTGLSISKTACLQEKQSCKQVWFSPLPNNKQPDLKPTVLKIWLQKCRWNQDL